MFKSFTQVALALCFILGFNQLNAQDKVSLGNFNGIEVSYTLQFLGSIDKKKAEKSRDEYQLTVWATNGNAQDLYCTNNNGGGVKIANAKSTRKTVQSSAINSQLLTVQGGTLFMFKTGATIQGTGKIKVQKGIDPVVTYANACNFQPLSNFDIQASAGLVNGTWKAENGTTTMQLTFNNTETGATINQQAPNGTIVVWYKVGPKTFQRAFVGASANLNDATSDQNQTYTAKITFIGMNRVQYTNSEGITINWIKQN